MKTDLPGMRTEIPALMPGDIRGDELEPANWRLKNVVGTWPYLLQLWGKDGQ